VLEDGVVVTLNFLLDLKSMNVFGEAFDLASTDGVDQASLADTITANKSVFGALS
jgi:hypothetical protein